jgi:hypothetical protein
VHKKIDPECSKIAQSTARLHSEKFDVCFAHMGIFMRWKYENQKILSLTPSRRKTIIHFFNKQGTDLWQQESNL